MKPEDAEAIRLAEYLERDPDGFMRDYEQSVLLDHIKRLVAKGEAMRAMLLRLREQDFCYSRPGSEGCGKRRCDGCKIPGEIDVLIGDTP